jgi:hypothetical protein
MIYDLGNRSWKCGILVLNALDSIGSRRARPFALSGKIARARTLKLKRRYPQSAISNPKSKIPSHVDS